LGRGDGTFAPRLAIPAGNGPGALALADLDHDRALDLVIANGASETVLTRLGNGDGTFGAGARDLDSFNVMGLGVAEFDRDGNLDLVVPYGRNFPPLPSSGDLSVLAGHGDGTFGSEAHLPGTIARGPAITGDFDADGHPDFAVTNPANGSVSVFLGRGDGTF